MRRVGTASDVNWVLPQACQLAHAGNPAPGPPASTPDQCSMMPEKSVDALQKALARDVFHYAADTKKAAGRALGTLVEIITFYLLKSWGLEKNISIERRLPEYGNPDITHNVEFSLHPSADIGAVVFDDEDLPITAGKIRKLFPQIDWSSRKPKSMQLLSANGVLRNACAIHEDENRIFIAYLDKVSGSRYRTSVRKLATHPFAVVECKRVGVEEGTKKGPQTIEKAKQGAYVARSLSSVQKIRMRDGSIYGVLDSKPGRLRCEPYDTFLQEIVKSSDMSLLRDFTLTVGVVSNHGNWFTSDDPNKELKVLAQSYDWLLFLTDQGLASFTEKLLIKPVPKYQPVRDAFLKSYRDQRGDNVFTKVRVDLAADRAIQKFFALTSNEAERWLNVVSPAGRSISELRQELRSLAGKNWEELLS